MASLAHVLERIKASPHRYYVYALKKPCGTPFYVGKGADVRVARHEQDASRTSKKCHRLNTIRKIVAGGQAVGYELVGFYATADEAANVERELIGLLGRMDLGAGPLTNKTDGGDGWRNPSAGDRAKIAESVRRRMADPEARRKAVAAIRSPESQKKREEAQRIAAKKDSFRIKQSQISKERWRTRRDVMLAAQAAARAAPGYREKQLAGVARVQADPAFHAKRNAGRDAHARNGD